MVMFSQKLDPVILEVFSNPTDPVILCFRGDHSARGCTDFYKEIDS